MPSEEGPKCPTCHKHYLNIEKHGRKWHPYEVEHEAAWIALLSGAAPAAQAAPVGRSKAAKAKPTEIAEPPPPPRPSMREVRETIWDHPMPYRGTVMLLLDARSHTEADKIVHDLMVEIKKLCKAVKVVADLDQVNERF